MSRGIDFQTKNIPSGDHSLNTSSQNQVNAYKQIKLPSRDQSIEDDLDPDLEHSTFY